MADGKDEKIELHAEKKERMATKLRVERREKEEKRAPVSITFPVRGVIWKGTRRDICTATASLVKRGGMRRGGSESGKNQVRWGSRIKENEKGGIWSRPSE